MWCPFYHCSKIIWIICESLGIEDCENFSPRKLATMSVHVCTCVTFLLFCSWLLNCLMLPWMLTSGR